MNDFISMMGYREMILAQIEEAVCGVYMMEDIERICSQCGLPWNDLLYDEKQRVLRASNV